MYNQDAAMARERSHGEGFEPSQLGKLTEIGGSLCISNLEKVQTKEEAGELKLVHKKYLRELILEWDVERSNKDPVQEGNVLESLVPHSDLQVLDIKGHGGSSCPTWLCANLSLKSLGSLCLYDVSWKNLPPLGEMWMVNEHGEEYQGCSMSPPTFHNLKRLQLIKICWLKKWVGNGACPLFSCLESLIVRDCSELIELPFSDPTCYKSQWGEKIGWFPKLYELVIVKCPKLASVPSIPWRTGAPWSAEIAGVGSGIERLVYPTYGSKESLKIEGNGGQGDVLWNGINFSNLTDLKELYVNKCPPLPLDHLHVLTSLKKIEISGWSSVIPPVQSADHCIYQFPVENLRIKDCDTSGKELTLLISFLPNLSTLRIDRCENITGLGVAEHAETVSGEQQQTRGEEEILAGASTAAEGLLLLPPQLQELTIFSCKMISLLSNSPPHDDHTKLEGRGGGLQRLRSLCVLRVDHCPKFFSNYSSLPSYFFPFPTCLQHLYIRDVNYMKTMQALSNLTSLIELSLLGCEGSRDEGLWPLLAHGRLTKLCLFNTPDFFSGSDTSRLHDKEVFSRSCMILELQTRQNTGFLAASICNLFSSTLRKLELSHSLDKVEGFTEEQEESLVLLASLQELQFPSGPRMQRLPAGLHKLTNLKKLEVLGCPLIQSLPSLPSSLQELEIRFCDAIKSLPSSLPDSLEKLVISRCQSIKSLPKAGLPSSMRKLDAYDGNSEELKRECRKLIGTIPIIRA